MALAVEEVLSLWREAERLLDVLPLDAPERKDIAADVADLKRIYNRLTLDNDATGKILASSRETLSVAREALDAAKRGVGDA